MWKGSNVEGLLLDLNGCSQIYILASKHDLIQLGILVCTERGPSVFVMYPNLELLVEPTVLYISSFAHLEIRLRKQLWQALRIALGSVKTFLRARRA